MFMPTGWHASNFVGPPGMQDVALPVPDDAPYQVDGLCEEYWREVLA
jgi:hypothetical protein